MRISKSVTFGQKAILKPVGGESRTGRRTERFRSLSKLPMDLWLKHVVLLAGGVFMMLPFIWMFLSSVKSTEEIFSGSLLALPKVWHWEHYGQAWKKAPFDRFYEQFGDVCWHCSRSNYDKLDGCLCLLLGSNPWKKTVVSSGCLFDDRPVRIYDDSIVPGH